jgi:hypothetical protein
VLLVAVAWSGAAGAETRPTAETKPAGDANSLADAIIDGNTPQALKLLAAVPELARSRSGDGTQLHWAVQCGNVAIAKALLAAGADVSAADDKGGAPLHWAVRGPDADANCVDLLIARGAKVDAKNKEGDTALMALAKEENSQYAAMVKTLLRHKASLTAVDGKGRSAMALASYEHRPAMVEALAAGGAEVDLPAAVVIARIDLVRKFLEAPGELRPRGEGAEGYWADLVEMTVAAMEKAGITPEKPNRRLAAKIASQHVELLGLLGKKGVEFVDGCVWKAVGDVADPAVADWLLANKYRPAKPDSVEGLCKTAMGNDYCPGEMLQTVRRRMGEPAEKYITDKAPKELAAWVEKLKSTDAAERLAAAKQIGSFAPVARSAVPALKRAMADGDATLRDEAAEAVKAIEASAEK